MVWKSLVKEGCRSSRTVNWTSSIHAGHWPRLDPNAAARRPFRADSVGTDSVRTKLPVTADPAHDCSGPASRINVELDIESPFDDGFDQAIEGFDLEVTELFAKSFMSAGERFDWAEVRSIKISS